MAGDPEGNYPRAWIAWFFGLLFNLDKQVAYVGEWGISRALYLGILFIGLYLVLAHMVPSLPLFTFNWLVGTSPIWLPLALWISGWYAWTWYIQSLFLSGRDPVLLEMRIPREVRKSPRAMELAFAAFSISSGETTFIHRGWKGQVRPIFSFEIASFGGDIHFYIWCWRAYKNTVEAAIYAQYPEVELVEVEDYASALQYDPQRHNMFATGWRKESHSAGIKGGDYAINAFPIRTYLDFELEKDPKEEFKIDPLAQVLEFMGSILPHEQIWMQIVLRKCGKKGGVLFMYDEDDVWLETVHRQIDRLVAQSTQVKKSLIGKEDSETFPSFLEEQKRLVTSMERNATKYPFEVGMRGTYISLNGELRGPIYTGNRWIWRPFGDSDSGAYLKPLGWHCDFDYPWQDVHDLRWVNQARRFLDAYRRRSVFHTPWITPTNVLTNEELASIWHPPSETVATPGLRRVPATKAEPPANLPR